MRGLILRPAPPLLGASASSQLHGRLLVLPLDHLVVLPVLQVGSQLCVLSLLGPLPWGVALGEGVAAISSGTY